MGDKRKKRAPYVGGKVIPLRQNTPPPPGDRFIFGIAELIVDELKRGNDEATLIRSLISFAGMAGGRFTVTRRLVGRGEVLGLFSDNVDRGVEAALRDKSGA